jgi:ABC-type amino acid transport substrate-binding protein
MANWRKSWCLAFLMAGVSSLTWGQELVFLAPKSQTMPLADFQGDRLVDGIVKDLSEAIGARLGLPVRFLAMPSKRLGKALADGEADGVCYVLPLWIDGDFHWSRPLIPTAEVIVANPPAPQLRQLADLAEQPVGTVLGYRYPLVDAALGERFRREDALDMGLLFAKQRMGRTRYAIVDQLSLSYHLKIDPKLSLRSDLVLSRSVNRCAFSRSSKIPIKTFERAIDAMVTDGEVERILGRYR